MSTTPIPPQPPTVGVPDPTTTQKQNEPDSKMPNEQAEQGGQTVLDAEVSQHDDDEEGSVV